MQSMMIDIKKGFFMRSNSEPNSNNDQVELIPEAELRDSLRRLLRHPEIQVNTPSDTKMIMQVLMRKREYLTQQRAAARDAFKSAEACLMLKEKFPKKNETFEVNGAHFALDEPVDFYRAKKDFYLKELELINNEIRDIEVAKVQLKYK